MQWVRLMLLAFVVAGITAGTGGCCGPCSVPCFLIDRKPPPDPPRKPASVDGHVDLVRPSWVAPATKNLPVTEIEKE